MRDGVKVSDAVFNYTLELHESCREKFSNKQIASIVAEYVTMVFETNESFDKFYEISLNLCTKWDSEA